MTHNDLEEYKKAVKSKYEVEKKGIYSSFLLQPSRANLRNLCAERFKENNSVDDLATYKLFFGFEYEKGNRYGLNDKTGLFRSIENFFKGITDTNDIETLNIAAILVDFNPRPFRKFSKVGPAIENPDSGSGIFNGGKEIDRIKGAGNTSVENLPGVLEKNKISLKRKIAIGISIIVVIFSVGYTTKQFVIPKKHCMQWQVDHYEKVDCEAEIDSLFANAPIEPIDEKAIDLRKIEVCDTFPFFCGDKAVVWYCKVGDEPEYFDGPGAGFHPITKKQLNPITDYIIDKYVKRR